MNATQRKRLFGLHGRAESTLSAAERDAAGDFKAAGLLKTYFTRRGGFSLELTADGHKAASQN